jgi:probable rRNA maturation factor
MASERSSVLFRIPARGVGRRPLLAFARQLESDVAQGRAFCCLISGDKELHRLNRHFRKKDYATDVLSFPHSAEGRASPSRGNDRHLGELAISLDRARAQAAHFGHSVEDEIRILMLHGVLHLTGLDHARDNGQMARVEALWRRRLGLPSGLIERAS